MRTSTVRRSPLREVLHHRWEIAQVLTRRDIQERYRGSVMGVLWSFLTPILMLLAFTFVFTVIFEAKWGVEIGEDRGRFAMMLLCGLLVYMYFAECANRAPGLVLGRPNYVKKIVFPLDTLGIMVVGSGAFHLLIGLAGLVAVNALLNGLLHWTALLLPLIMLPLLLFVLAVVWVLSAIGVYLRDVGQVVAPLVQLMLFLSPVFYPLEALPADLRPWLQASPLAYTMEETRVLVMSGALPDWSAWWAYSGAGVIAAALALAWFRKARHGFADVL